MHGKSHASGSQIPRESPPPTTGADAIAMLCYCIGLAALGLLFYSTDCNKRMNAYCDYVKAALHKHQQ